MSLRETFDDILLAITVSAAAIYGFLRIFTSERHKRLGEMGPRTEVGRATPADIPPEKGEAPPVPGELCGTLEELRAALRRKEDELLECRKQFEQVREFGRKLTVIQQVYIDAILLGPRDSGKSSVAELWEKPWHKVEETETTTVWNEYEANLYEYKTVRKKDLTFAVDRPLKKVLRLRLRDYPGEGAQLVEALDHIGRLDKKVVLILFMLVGVTDRNDIIGNIENSEYFNHVFVEMVKSLKSVSESVLKVFVVFNKSDVLPSDWAEEEALERLKLANAPAVHSIKHIFGHLIEFHLISAQTNRGMIRLLGSIGRLAIEGKDDSERFQRKLSRWSEGST